MRSFVKLLVCLCANIPLGAQQLDTTHWITNGPVYALEAYGGKLYAGGEFDQVSPCTGFFIQTDSSTGAVLPWPKVNGPVYCIEKDTLDGYYIGGSFSRVGNLSLANLFHINGQGQVDLNFLPDPSGPVYTLKRVGYRLFAGGAFSTFAGVPTTNAGVMDISDNTAVPAWNPQVDGPVLDMDFDPTVNQLIIVGSFTHVGGLQRNGIAKIDTLQGHVWQYPGPISQWIMAPADGLIRSVKVDVAHNQVFIGGDFNYVESLSRPGLALLNLFSGALNPPVPNVLGSVYDMELSGGKLYIAGNFTSVGAQPRARLACISTADMHPLAWNPGANNLVCSILLDDQKIYAAGDFTYIGSQPRFRVAVLDTFTAFTVEPYAPYLNATGRICAPMPQGKIIAGGDFTGVGGFSCRNICRLDLANGTGDASWTPLVDHAVRLLSRNNDQLFVAGDFALAGGQARSRICSFDLNTGLVTGFNPGCDGLIRCIAYKNDTVFIGGNFTITGTVFRTNIAALNYPSGTALNWTPAIPGTVNALAVQATGLVAAGYFSQAANSPCSNIVRLDAVSGLADPLWAPVFNDGIYALLPYGNTYYAGGWFQTLNGQPLPFLTNIDRDSAAPLLFNEQLDNFTRQLLISNNTLFAAGAFSSAQNVSNNGFAAFNLTNGDLLPFSPDFNSDQNAMLATGGQLFVGGSFTTADETVVSRLAVYDVSALTGLAENKITIAERLEVYPNPATDQVLLRTAGKQPLSAKAQFTIRDVTGRIVLSCSNTGNGIVNVSTLPAGLYSIECRLDEQLFTAKLVKE